MLCLLFKLRRNLTGGIQILHAYAKRMSVTAATGLLTSMLFLLSLCRQSISSEMRP